MVSQLRKIVLFWTIVFPLIGFSQIKGLSNIWELGYYGGATNGGAFVINFDSLQPTPQLTPTRKMNFMQTNASISNENGNLLFYTNGGWIANSTGDSLLNGRLPYGTYNNRFSGEEVPQECLFLPAPGDTNIYYMFYNLVEVFMPGFFASKYLYYLTIDKRLDNGLGAVVQKNVIAIGDTLIVGEITACKHGNGRDWWIVCHRINSNLFYKLLLTPQGVSAPVSQSIGDTMHYVQATGQAVFSPDGSKYSSYHARYTDNDLLVLDFDRCNGDFFNPLHVSIDDSSSSGGVAFSPNSRFLYVCSRNYVYQFDMIDTNIALSKKKVATYDGYYSPQPPFASSFFLAQMANDGKIYINSTNSVVDLHRINYPDSIGISCNVAQHSVPLPAYNAFTIPNHPNYFLGADSGSVCDTLQLAIRTNDSSSPKDKFSIFPNPASDIVQLAYTPNNKLRAIEILDVNGKIVLKSSIPQWSQFQRIDVRVLNSGIYLCRFTGGNEASVKFMVERD